MPPRPGQVRMGGTRAQAPSPLPQENPGSGDGSPYSGGAGPPPVQISNGFTANMPGRTRVFFQRVFFLDYPSPIQMGLIPPFPMDLTIMKLLAPKEQVIVFNDVTFQVLIHSGIGVDDVTALDPSRAATFLGFQFTAGSRSISDYQTNLSARGVPVVSNQQTGQLVAPRAGGGPNWPFAGSIVPKNDKYSGYIMPGQEYVAKVSIFRAPNYDIRSFTVSIQGWAINETEWNRIMETIAGR